MARFHLRTLGGLSLHEGSPDEPAVLGASKSLAVLVYLARAPGRAALRSHLSELLWPGLPRKKARRALRQCLYYLTQRAGTELWAADDGRLSLADGKLEVDVWTLDRALEEERWADAVEVYGGPFMAGFDGKAGLEFEHWAEAQHERVWAGVKAACHRLVEEALQGEPADPARAVRYAARCVDLNPLDERAQEALVRAHLTAGDRVEAFRAYEAYRTLLREELGEVPGPELAYRTEEIRAALFGKHPEGARRAPERRTPEVVRQPGEPGGEEPIWPGQPHHDLRTAAGTGAEGRSPPEDAVMAGGGAPPGPPPSGPADAAPASGDTFPPGWRGLAWGLLGAAAAVVIMMVGAGWQGTGARAREADPGAAPVVDLLIARTGNGPHGGRTDSAVDVRVGGASRVTVTEVARDTGNIVVSPDGHRSTVHLSGAHGVDIGVRDGSGPVRKLTDAPADEWPLEWSPDGRYLLYHYGVRLQADRLFVSRLAVADAITGRVTRFPVVQPTRADSQGTWSPTGTAIAFRGTLDGHSHVYVADVDGRHQVEVSGGPGPDAQPAWSPDGRLLAFASKRNGSWDLYVVRPDGSGLQQLTYAPGDETSPVWLSGHEIAYVADRGGESDLWSVDLTARSVRRLTRQGDLSGVFRTRRTRNPDLVTRVRIEPRFRTVSPGQVIDFRGRALDRAGHPAPPAAARLRWSTTDTSVVRLDREGRARVLGPGPAEVVVSAGGWRADTLRLGSAMLTDMDPPLLLDEDWSGGIDTRRWIRAGLPLPRVVAARGRFARAFLNDGDANYGSGVLSRADVPLSDGITIAWWARLPFDGRNFERLGVGLTTGTSPRPEDRGPPHADVVMFSTPSHGIGALVAAGAGTRQRGQVAVPLPDDPAAWHRYALEVRPDGTVLYVLDGRLRWRSEPGFVSPVPAHARLTIFGNSLSAPFVAGPVKVWRGVRWRLPGTPAQAKLARR